MSNFLLATMLSSFSPPLLSIDQNRECALLFSHRKMSNVCCVIAVIDVGVVAAEIAAPGTELAHQLAVEGHAAIGQPEGAQAEPVFADC